jgi:hypothetical protein
MKTTLTALLFALFATCLFAVPDDGNPATGRARFSWVQDPSDTIVTGYRVTFWKDGQTPAQGVTEDVPSAPQTAPTTAGSVIIDGFVEGQKYQMHAQSSGKLSPDGPVEYSDPCPTVSFTYITKIPAPKLPKVEIQVSKDLNTWRTIAFIPLDDDMRFVRARLALATADK